MWASSSFQDLVRSRDVGIECVSLYQELYWGAMCGIDHLTVQTHYCGCVGTKHEHWNMYVLDPLFEAACVASLAATFCGGAGSTLSVAVQGQHFPLVSLTSRQER
jgi:hypothetical protein